MTSNQGANFTSDASFIYLLVTGTPKPNQLDSYEELLDDTTGAGYYIDTEVGALFRKFQVTIYPSKFKFFWMCKK